MSYLRSKPALIMSAILILQIAVTRIVPSGEYRPQSPSLTGFSRQFNGWETIAEPEMDKSVQEILKADDSINRSYRGPAGELTSLFVAFYRTQRAGVSPHSPQVCLPGAGWEADESRRMTIAVPSRDPIEVRRYTVSRRDSKSVVIYWYETPYRVIASEYAAKFYLMLDSLRYRRSDTWLVRVIAPALDGDTAAAERTAVGFIKTVYPHLKAYMPSAEQRQAQSGEPHGTPIAGANR